MFEPHLNDRQTRIDWLLVASAIGLMMVGLLFIYSAKQPLETTPWYNQFAVRQVIWYSVGIVAAIGIALIDYHSLSRWSVIAYWTSILLLIVVLIPGIGAARGGARRWIDLGPFQLQPSEFAKLAFLFAQAHFLSRPNEELRRGTTFLKSIGLTLLPFLLILKEPDLGSALVLLPVGLTMMFLAGVPPRFLLRLIGGLGGIVLLLLIDILFAPPNWQIKLEEYQRHRLLVFFGRDFAPANATPEQLRRARQLQAEKTYQVKQALISVGSGGFTGRGWRKGQQIALGFLPPGAAHNDFIFSVIAEETGFLGSLVVLLLYMTLLFAGLRIAAQSRDRLGRLLAAGVVALLFSHVFVNIGMNIRLMPVTGIPLPLLSYGGSSVLCSLLAIGILQNISIHRRS
jgi:rod shape determining protein RodA